MNDFLDTQKDDIVIGIDLGGTNLRAAAFRGLATAVRARRSPDEPIPEAATPVVLHREPVGTLRDPDSIVERLAAVIRRLAEQIGAEGPVPVGIGFAGMLRGRDGFVANSPHLGWRGVPFGVRMRAALGGAHPVVVHNDVNAITFGEYALGAASGSSDVLAVFVGTGIGGGVISDGRLIDGATGCAAEIGHTKVVYDASALPCACGLKGCVEAYAGGAPLQARIRAELSSGVRSAAVRLAGSPEVVNPGHLDAAAAEGDDYALTLYTEIAPYLGVALANAVTLLNPACLVLGGGVLSRTPVLREHAIAAFEVAVNPPALDGLRITDAALGDDAGLVGSALLAMV